MSMNPLSALAKQALATLESEVSTYVENVKNLEATSPAGNKKANQWIDSVKPSEDPELATLLVDAETVVRSDASAQDIVQIMNAAKSLVSACQDQLLTLYYEANKLDPSVIESAQNLSESYEQIKTMFDSLKSWEKDGILEPGSLEKSSVPTRFGPTARGSEEVLKLDISKAPKVERTVRTNSTFIKLVVDGVVIEEEIFGVAVKNHTGMTLKEFMAFLKTEHHTSISTPGWVVELNGKTFSNKIVG